MGTQLIMPKIKLLSHATLLIKQSMAECGMRKSCPHLACLGKKKRSNKGKRHKVRLQLIFRSWGVDLISGYSRGPAVCISLPPLFRTSKIITYLDPTMTSFLLQVEKSLIVWMIVKGKGEMSEAVISSWEINILPLFNMCKNLQAVTCRWDFYVGNFVILMFHFKLASFMGTICCARQRQLTGVLWCVESKPDQLNVDVLWLIHLNQWQRRGHLFSRERAIYQQWLISSNTGLPRAGLIHQVPITVLCQRKSNCPPQ